MTILLGSIFTTGVLAVLAGVRGWTDSGRPETDDWDGNGRVVSYPLAQWALENPPHHHSEPTLAEVTTCRYCGSTAHSTFLHASR